MTDRVLELEDMQVLLPPDRGAHALVRSITLAVDQGEFVCLVGESGSGKTVTCDAILGLSQDSGLDVRGSIRFAGRELVGTASSEMRQFRGREMALIPQDPMGGLDPVFTVGSQLVEAIRRAKSCSRADARKIAVELLERVRIPDPGSRLKQYPHQLSGGLCQRILISMALAAQPRLLIADEPTSALDVTVQAQILALIEHARDELGTTVVCITHDMGVAALADRVAVLYAGTLIETGPTAAIFAAPRHPYTAGLISSVPRMDGASGRHRPLPAMPGSVPQPGAVLEGCVFAPRCPLAIDRCAEAPPTTNVGPGHTVACWRADELAEPGSGLKLWASLAPVTASSRPEGSP